MDMGCQNILKYLQHVHADYLKSCVPTEFIYKGIYRSTCTMSLNLRRYGEVWMNPLKKLMTGNDSPMFFLSFVNSWTKERAVKIVRSGLPRMNVHNLLPFRLSEADLNMHCLIRMSSYYKGVIRMSSHLHNLLRCGQTSHKQYSKVCLIFHFLRCALRPQGCSPLCSPLSHVHQRGHSGHRTCG